MQVRYDHGPVGGGRNREERVWTREAARWFCAARTSPLYSAESLLSPACDSCSSCQSLQLTPARPSAAAVVGNRRPSMTY